MRNLIVNAFSLYFGSLCKILCWVKVDNFGSCYIWNPRNFILVIILNFIFRARFFLTLYRFLNELTLFCFNKRLSLCAWLDLGVYWELIAFDMLVCFGLYHHKRVAYLRGWFCTRSVSMVNWRSKNLLLTPDNIVPAAKYCALLGMNRHDNRIVLLVSCLLSYIGIRLSHNLVALELW